MGCFSTYHRNVCEHLEIILLFASGGLHFDGILITMEMTRQGEIEECNLSAEYVTIQFVTRRERSVSIKNSDNEVYENQ